MFQTAGASWYVRQLRDEGLDSICYSHHLSERLASIKSLARMMKEDDGMTLSMASTVLEYLCGDHPPKPHPTRQRND